MIVNDYFGGDIIRADVILPNNEKNSHFFNYIDGKEIDFTSSQFPNGTIIPKGVEKRKTLQLRVSFYYLMKTRKKDMNN